MDPDNDPVLSEWNADAEQIAHRIAWAPTAEEIAEKLPKEMPVDAGEHAVLRVSADGDGWIAEMDHSRYGGAHTLGEGGPTMVAALAALWLAFKEKGRAMGHNITINVDMNARCVECLGGGATDNGLCLACITKAIRGRAMRSEIGKALQRRVRARAEKEAKP